MCACTFLITSIVVIAEHYIYVSANTVCGPGAVVGGGIYASTQVVKSC